MKVPEYAKCRNSSKLEFAHNPVLITHLGTKQKKKNSHPRGYFAHLKPKAMIFENKI